MDEKEIEKIFIGFLLIIGIFYMFLAFNTNMLGEDESVYYGLAKDISQGNYPAYTGYYPAPQMLSPLLSLTAAPFILILGESLAALKATAAFFFLLTLLIIYLIGKRINIWLGIFSAGLLFSISMLSHISMLAYLDGPVAFFSALVFYLMLKMKDTSSSVILGLVMGISFYMKPSCLIFAAILVAYALYYKKKIKLVAIALGSFFVMLIPFLVRNLILFNYPFVEGFNFLFASPEIVPMWLTEAFKVISPVSLNLQFYIGSVGWLLLLLMLFSLPYMVSKSKINKKEHELLVSAAIFIFVLFIIFNITHITGRYILEERHLSIMFPQIVLIAGYFLWRLKEFNKYMLPLIVIVLLLSMSIGIGYAIDTSNMQRYSNLYLESLNWVKQNTEQNAVVFTTYIGSLYYYGERDSLWIIDEFPDLMTTRDSGYIKSVLKENDVSYILIWKNLIAESYIVPKANLLGVYTYTFVDTIASDIDNFEMVFNNGEVFIFKIL